MHFSTGETNHAYLALCLLHDRLFQCLVCLNIVEDPAFQPEITNPYPSSCDNTSVVLVLPSASSVKCTLGYVKHIYYTQQGQITRQYPLHLECGWECSLTYLLVTVRVFPDSRKLFWQAKIAEHCLPVSSFWKKQLCLTRTEGLCPLLSDKWWHKQLLRLIWRTTQDSRSVSYLVSSVNHSNHFFCFRPRFQLMSGTCVTRPCVPGGYHGCHGHTNMGGFALSVQIAGLLTAEKTLCYPPKTRIMLRGRCSLAYT